MIRVSKLTKDYGARRAVHELDFSIEKGEIVAFLGPNGAGKTTTMRILSGYMPPTSGVVTIGGYDLMEQSMEVRKIIGYMPETIPLYNDMSVFEYLMFMGQLRNVKDIDDRVDEVLQMVHLESRADGYIGNLSKGMRQRVGLAQAILHKPEVLILDEPTIGLDPVQIIEVRNMIRDIGKEHTIILSTHILSEAQQVCNRVLIINKGKLVAEDTTEGLRARVTGAQRVTLRVRGDIAPVIPAVESVPGVLRVKGIDDETLEFESAPGQDVRPLVARAVADKFDLLDIHQSSMSLEEIFLQLTRDDVNPPRLDGSDGDVNPITESVEEER